MYKNVLAQELWKVKFGRFRYRLEARSCTIAVGLISEHDRPLGS